MARRALAAPDLVRVGVINHDGGIGSPTPGDGHSASPSSETEKELSPEVDRPAFGIIEIELPSGVNVRIDASAAGLHRFAEQSPLDSLRVRQTTNIYAKHVLSLWCVPPEGNRLHRIIRGLLEVVVRLSS